MTQHGLATYLDDPDVNRLRCSRKFIDRHYRKTSPGVATCSPGLLPWYTTFVALKALGLPRHAKKEYILKGFVDGLKLTRISRSCRRKLQ